jgi:hypothetical protein
MTTQSQSAISGLRRVLTTLPPWSGKVAFSLPQRTGPSLFRPEDPLDGQRFWKRYTSWSLCGDL